MSLQARTRSSFQAELDLRTAADDFLVDVAVSEGIWMCVGTH